MKKILSLGLVMILTLSMLTACGGGNSENNTPSNSVPSNNENSSTPASDNKKTEDNKTSTATFENGVLTTDAAIIEITGYRVIPVGSPEHVSGWGGNPILEIMFSYTNLGNGERSPLRAFISYIFPYQGEEMKERCTLAGYTDGTDYAIAPGETFAGGISYVLEEDTVIFNLLAEVFLEKIGTMTLDLTGHL